MLEAVGGCWRLLEAVGGYGRLREESITQSGRHSGRRWKKMEEDGRRWKKMDEKKSSKKYKKIKKVKKKKLSGKCLGCFWELSWVTNSPKKNILVTWLRKKNVSESLGNLTNRFVLNLLSFLKHSLKDLRGKKS